MTQCIQLLGPCTPPLQSKSHFIHSVASGFRRGNQASISTLRTRQLHRYLVHRCGVLGVADAIGSPALTAGISRDPLPPGVDSLHTMISLSTLYNSAQWPSADLEDPRRDIPEVCFRCRIFSLNYLYGYKSAAPTGNKMN